MFISTQLMSQNLIPNAGFEYNRKCPSYKNKRASLAIGWFNATSATPDYYHACGTGHYQTPNNQYKNLIPFGGKAYIGLYFSPSNMEYIETRLKEPLKSGVEYKVNLYVIASDTFNYLTSDIGFYFSKKRLHSERKSRILNIQPQVVSAKDNILSPDKWTEVNGTFIAKGGEKFVTIGSFLKNPKKLNISGKNYANKAAYLFIDNVSTAAIERATYSLPKKGEIKILKTIYFEHDKYILNKESFQELTELTELLKDSNHVKIEILGHTDISGDEEHNITLSKQRASVVVNYLVKKGISKDRLKSKGLGSSVPVNLKDKKQGLNRRVEFRVIN